MALDCPSDDGDDNGFEAVDFTAEGHMRRILRDVQGFQILHLPCFIEIGQRVEIIEPRDPHGMIREILADENVITLASANVLSEYNPNTMWKTLCRNGVQTDEIPESVPHHVIDAFFHTRSVESYSSLEDLQSDLLEYYDELKDPPPDFFDRAYARFLLNLPENLAEPLLIALVVPFLNAGEFRYLPKQARTLLRKNGHKDLIERFDQPGERLRRDAAAQFRQWTGHSPSSVGSEEEFQQLALKAKRGDQFYRTYLNALGLKPQPKNVIGVVRALAILPNLEDIRTRATAILTFIDKQPDSQSA